MTAVIVGLVTIVAVVAYIGSVSGAGVFQRYLTITPGKLVSALSENRGQSIAAIPQLATHHPLGNGLGSVGPASGFAGGGNAGSNGETEPGFLLSEMGIPGLLVVYGFMFHLLYLGVTRIRRLESETRILVSALLAGLVGLLILGISSSTTATPPGSAFLWLTGGVLSYWLVTAMRDQTPA
jgi:O-antigen ligase